MIIDNHRFSERTYIAKNGSLFNINFRCPNPQSKKKKILLTQFNSCKSCNPVASNVNLFKVFFTNCWSNQPNRLNSYKLILMSRNISSFSKIRRHFATICHKKAPSDNVFLWETFFLVFIQFFRKVALHWKCTRIFPPVFLLQIYFQANFVP